MIPAVRALDEYAAEWRRLPRATARERAAADAYYDAQVLPLLRIDFVEREHAQLPRRYTGLVIAAGADPTPAILSLAVLQPERVHFVYRDEAEPALERALQVMSRPATAYDRTRVDDPAILQAYAAVRDVHAAWGSPAGVAVDITGGPPAVAAGMAMAAYTAGADLMAIEAEEWWPEVDRPRPGSEHLSFLPQPYAAFGDLAEAETQRGLCLRGLCCAPGAQRAWAARDFALARELFTRLAEGADAARYGPYRDLAEGYAAWEAFDAAGAARGLEAALGAIERAPAHPLAAHRDRLRAQASATARLAALLNAEEEPPELDVLTRLDWVSGLAFSLRRDARDHAAAGRYNLAALLQYRLLELLVQRRLALRGISTVAPDYDRLGLGDPAAAVAERRLARLGEEEDHLPRNVGLGVGLVLLDLIGDPLAGATDWALLRESLPARSRSVLVHGFRALERGSDLAFERLLEPIFEAFCRAEALDCAGLERSFAFVEI